MENVEGSRATEFVTVCWGDRSGQGTIKYLFYSRGILMKLVRTCRLVVSHCTLETHQEEYGGW